MLRTNFLLLSSLFFLVSCTNKLGSYKGDSSQAVRKAVTGVFSYASGIPQNPTFRTPCVQHTGLPLPTEASGICTGNLMFPILLPTLDFSLIYNSVAPAWDFGYGFNFTLDIDRRFSLSPTDPSSAFRFDGDGSSYAFTKDSNGKWISNDLRRTVARFEGTDSLKELANDGTVSQYQQLDNYNYALSAITDRNGNSVKFVRNAGFQIERIEMPFGRPITIAYSNGKAYSLTDAAGGEYRLKYDAQGRLETVEYPNGTAWKIGYGSGTSEISSFLSPNGEEFRIGYYSAGLVKSFETPSTITYYAYTQNQAYSGEETPTYKEFFDKNRRPYLIMDSVGYGTLSWDSMGRLNAHADNFGETTVYRYEGSSFLPNAIESKNKKKVITYDPEMRMTKLEITQGPVVSSVTYSPALFGLPIRSTRNGKVTSFEYDSLGNLVKVLAPNGRPMLTAKYNDKGLPIEETDEYGHKTSYAYQDGKLVTETSPLKQVTSFSHNQLGLVTSATFPGGYQVSQEFDPVGIPVGKSEMRGPNSQTVSSTLSFSRHGTGSIQSITSEQSVLNRKQVQRFIQYGITGFPLNIVGETLTNSRGEVWKAR